MAQPKNCPFGVHDDDDDVVQYILTDCYPNTRNTNTQSFWQGLKYGYTYQEKT